MNQAVRTGSQGARRVDDLDYAPSGRDFASAAGAGSNDLVGPRTTIGSYDHIALHDASVLRLTGWALDE